MGVSFTWKPVDPDEGISFASGSTLHRALEKAFGRFPITLSDKDIPVLRGMIYAGFSDLQALIDAFEDFSKIQINEHW